MVIWKSYKRLGLRANITWNPKTETRQKVIIENIINYSLRKREFVPMKWITDHWGLETRSK